MNWFKKRKNRKNAAARLYDVAVTGARAPVFYERLGVADTIDGRFDMLSLYVFLIMARLNQTGGEGYKLAQALFDRMFRMMDTTLREAGVGDLGVPKHMKKMMKAFNGRAHSYHEALASRNGDILLLAITRNIYRCEGEAVPAGAVELTDYVIDLHERLQALAFEDFMDDRFVLPAAKVRQKEAARAQAL